MFKNCMVKYGETCILDISRNIDHCLLLRQEKSDWCVPFKTVVTINGNDSSVCDKFALLTLKDPKYAKSKYKGC